jgi:predicted MPP superfamily phosphohydrolase
MWTGKPDLGKALEGVPREDFKLLLSHCPDFADIAAEHGVQLQLSGHSHGGQVAGWFMTHRFLPKYGRKYPIGLQQVSGTDTQVYTNVGIGAVTVPVRVGRRPEVTHIMLKKA